jgi:hypothetical protein
VTLVGISPYCTPRKQLICALPILAFRRSRRLDRVLGSTPVLAAGDARHPHRRPDGDRRSRPVIVFSYTVVSRTLAMLDTSAGSEEFYAAESELESAEQRDSVARMSARVAPFVQQIAEAGVITPENRALAAQLARRLRRELVNATSRSWLDVVAHETGMIVSDPARLADSMNESQRAALRGLLVAAMDSTVVDRRTLLIELASPGRRIDGSGALPIDVDLPEGRRLVLLAPVLPHA